MAHIVKVTTTADEGATLDAVEKLLTLAENGEDLIVFSDTGSIIYANTESGDNAHEFEEL